MRRAVAALLALLAAPASCRRCSLKEIQPVEGGEFNLGSCEELRLLNAKLGDAGAKRLAAALTTNRRVKFVDLWSNGIGPEGATALARALEGNKILEKLWLNENKVGAAGATALAAALGKKECGLQTLWLSDAEVGDVGATATRRRSTRARASASSTCGTTGSGPTAPRRSRARCRATTCC